MEPPLLVRPPPKSPVRRKESIHNDNSFQHRTSAPDQVNFNFHLWDRLSFSPGWPGTHYIAQDDLGLLIPLPLPLQCWGYTCTSSLCSAGNRTPPPHPGLHVCKALPTGLHSRPPGHVINTQALHQGESIFAMICGWENWDPVRESHFLITLQPKLPSPNI